ncbi:MAG: hypothetical protein R3E90_01800 [Marinicella sp.]|nr:hypothetical protein [Xanthomonadales bacterium]
MSTKNLKDAGHTHPSNTLDLVKNYLSGTLSGKISSLTFNDKYRNTKIGFRVPKTEFYELGDELLLEKLSAEDQLDLIIRKENDHNTFCILNLQYIAAEDFFYGRRTLSDQVYEVAVDSIEIDKHFILRIKYHGLDGHLGSDWHDGYAHPIP